MCYSWNYEQISKKKVKMHKIDSFFIELDFIKKQKMDKYFKRLPSELVNIIYKFVDYDTKIECLLNNNDVLMDKHKLWNNFTLKQMTLLYFHGITEKFSKKREDGLNRRVLRNEIFDMFPTGPSYGYIDQHGDYREFSMMHPVLEHLHSYKLNQTITNSSKITIIPNTIKSLRNITCQYLDVNYKVREILYKFLQSILFLRSELNRRIMEAKEKENDLKRRIEFNSAKEKIEKKFDFYKGYCKHPLKFSIHIK